MKHSRSFKIAIPPEISIYIDNLIFLRLLLRSNCYLNSKQPKTWSTKIVSVPKFMIAAQMHLKTVAAE